MKPEYKAAVKAGGATAVVTSVFALALATPVAWAFVAYGAYRFGKAAYQKERSRAILREEGSDPELFI
jgi:hypothetical protein